MNKNAYTLIELIIVIVVISIISVIAIPRYVNLSDEAKETSEQAVVGAVKQGIENYNMREALD